MICPACHLQNREDALVCSKCSSHFDTIGVSDSDAETIVSASTSGVAAGLSISFPAVLTPHTVLCDRYEIQQMLGSGGMGCVYKVLDRHLDRTIALKTIRPQFAADPTMLRRFKQEILLTREITHRNIIRIFDFGMDGDLCFITMELFEGEDLHARLERGGKLTPGQAIPIFCQICEGLASAHAENVVHRDLKPANILINSRDEIRILDFGLAHLYEGPTRSIAGGLVGTPDYMSPEQAKGEPVDARSDLFSAGIVFYEMLTGTLPFRGESLVARLVARTQERAQALSVVHPEIPLQISAIVGRCLERERGKRYASAVEVLHDLKQIVSLQRPTGAARAVASVRGWMRGPRALLAAGAAACVLAAVSWLGISRMAPKHAVSAPAAQSSEPFVAILPLSSSGKDSASFAEGVREAISSHLVSAKGLQPVSSAAVDKADVSKSDEDVARQLGANFLVRGKVERNQGKVQAKLTLFDARKNAVVWTEEFDAPPDGLFSLENELSTKLLSQFQAQPAPSAMIAPTQNMQAYDLYLQGRTAFKEKRNDAAESEKALALFEQAVGLDPNFAMAWSAVADASLNLYRLKHTAVDAQRAIDAAQRASANSNVAEVHLAAGSVYTQTGRHEEAIAEIQRALTLQPNSDDAYVRLGRAYLETGQTGAVIEALKNAVRLNPFYWYNQEQLARAYFRVGLDDEALAAFRKVAELNPQSSSAHLGIAGVLVRQGKWEESIPEYKKSLALQHTGTAYTSLGTALFYLKRYTEALPNFQKAAQLQPHDPLALGNLGSAYRQLDQKDKADAAFSQAIAAVYERLQLNARDAMMLGYLAVLHAYLQQSAEAVTFIQKARAIDPSSNELMYDEAVVHALSGPTHFELAVAALKKALANGYSLDEARHDPDLQTLKDIPEFRALLGGGH